MESTAKVCLTSAEIQKRLKDSGINPTAQRIAICRYVLCEACHPTVEDVKKWADENFPKMSLATVYNTLHALVEVGLLRSIKFPHMDKVVYDNNVDKHYHFLDDETEEILDIPADKLKIDNLLGSEFEVNDIEIVIRGKRKVN